jgi:integrase
MLSNSGENVKTVSELLGHSDVTMTLRVYSHILQEQHRQAVEKLPDITISTTSKLKDQKSLPDG